ncbi:hypothetical protein EW026_g6236 [Hermanssonia centrifuga]|uniref:Uncharacterized protein n=1 Tax=Hermanssonia centrifuga TaxID=98765 RepID=A0A4S4KBW9_9APHY|nr:hypothetical protein EW026_g6236 [Hermanssonia centrifuga]
MANWPEDNCAVGADGKLKDASEMDWAFSESKEQPPSLGPKALFLWLFICHA